jgi:hypothetical protein
MPKNIEYRKEIKRWRDKKNGKLISFEKADKMKQREITAHDKIIENKNQDFEKIATAKSSTDPNMIYEIFRNEGTGEVVCSCPGFTYRGHCKHSDSVKKDYENK